MKILGFIYMAGGCTLAILILRVAHGIWADFWEIAMTSAIPNGLTALLGIVFFGKPTPENSMHRVLLVLCYLVGIVAGCYFFFT